MTLFLEYFLDTEHLDFYNLTIANETLILTCIHEAYILHYDFFPRNILFSPSGQVVVVCIAPYFHMDWSHSHMIPRLISEM